MTKDGVPTKEKAHSKCFRATEIEVVLAANFQGERRSKWGWNSLTEQETARTSKQQGEVSKKLSIIVQGGSHQSKKLVRCFVEPQSMRLAASLDELRSK